MVALTCLSYELLYPADLSLIPEESQKNFSRLKELFDELNSTAVNISDFENDLSTQAGIYFEPVHDHYYSLSSYHVGSIDSISQVVLDAEMARNLTELSSDKVASIDDQIVRNSIEDVTVNTLNASVALDTSQGTCTYLNALLLTIQ